MIRDLCIEETVKAISVLPNMFCSSHIWGVGACGVDKRIELFSSLLIQIYSGVIFCFTLPA